MLARSMDNRRSGRDEATGSLASTFITATSNAQPIPGGLNVRRPDHSSSTNVIFSNLLVMLF
jgi:hypothetical protein